MLNSTQIKTMLTLQDDMNKKVNPQWQQAGYAYLRAAMIESVEAIEHHGWKWWKAQSKDLEQLQMELVDIWHFALSFFLLETQGDHVNAQALIESDIARNEDCVIFDGKQFDFAALSLLDNLQLMTGLCAANRFEVKLFLTIVKQCEMNSAALYQQYVGKNVLNFFRQDNGYKAGTYVKIWQGREDNEHLVEILESLDINADDYAKQIYNQLAERYPD